MPKLWLTASEISALPTSGAAYADCLKTSEASWGTADIHDSDYVHPIGCLAGALIAARTKNAATLAKTRSALAKIPGTEVGGQEGGQEPSLAVSRKLSTYIVAADLIDYREASFVAWAKTILDKKLSDGRSVKSVHNDRPNNWGTMAFASRVACDLYIGDTADLAKAVDVYRAWVGDAGAPAHTFKWGDMSWQADKSKPVGINRKGAKLSISGASRNVDGVQPDDQRRTGFQWPPAKGNYPWGALGSILVGLELLRHNGNDRRQAGDAAAARAGQWLVGAGANPPQGDDQWEPSLLGFMYPNFNWPGGSLRQGKHMAFTQWTHQGRQAGSVAPPQPEPIPPDSTDPCKPQRDAVAQAQAALDQAKKALADCEASSR